MWDPQLLRDHDNNNAFDSSVFSQGGAKPFSLGAGLVRSVLGDVDPERTIAGSDWMIVRHDDGVEVFTLETVDNTPRMIQHRWASLDDVAISISWNHEWLEDMSMSLNDDLIKMVLAEVVVTIDSLNEEFNLEILGEPDRWHPLRWALAMRLWNPPEPIEPKVTLI